MFEKKSLSRDDFKRICAEAAKHTTKPTDYVHEVRVGLRYWLGDRDPRGSVPIMTDLPTTEEAETQEELDVLMNFLKGRCKFDFLPGEVLNEAAIEARRSSTRIGDSSDGPDEHE